MHLSVDMCVCLFVCLWVQFQGLGEGKEIKLLKTQYISLDIILPVEYPEKNPLGCLQVFSFGWLFLHNQFTQVAQFVLSEINLWLRYK